MPDARRARQRGLEGAAPAHSVSLSPLHRRVSRSRQRRVRRAADERRARASRRDLRAGAPGIFFLSYVAFEIPSNIMLARVGARLWIARIMITWGLVSAAMMFVRGANGFYAMRFLLGAAEAGFFPGHHLLPDAVVSGARAGADHRGVHDRGARRRHRRRPGVGGAAVARRRGGLAGWQWLFLLEGCRRSLLGVVGARTLTERPADAGGCRPASRRWSRAWPRNARAATSRHTPVSPAEEPAGLAAGGRLLHIPVALYAMGFLLPQILRAASARSDFESGC